MFSNKENINILTSLLIEYGVVDAVVCPGSRNAPIVHNLSQCGAIHCHPVTDERSAGFYALGLAQATRRPTVVCVTSGTALLNLAPAVAEAYYQHKPLVVVSADRPQQWIDQLDGQTLPQPDALGRFVRKAVSLPEPHACSSQDSRHGEECWLCRRLVGEALLAATCRQPSPVHINVPVSEPLFTFDMDSLPQVGRFAMNRIGGLMDGAKDALERFLAAKRPMIVIGQMAEGSVSSATINRLMSSYVVFAEPLSNPSYTTVHFDEAVRSLTSMSPAEASQYTPDYILYVGDTIVSKPTRRWLRASNAPSCVVTADALDIHDPLMSLESVLECGENDIDRLLFTLCEAKQADDSQTTYLSNWKNLLDQCAAHAETYEPAYSQMAVVKYFEEQLADLDLDIYVHYANSTAIRLACVYAQHYVWCNRGVNGIEGSLSTAAGFSIATDDMTVCVIGDLSFFYDQNALWNNNLRGNLRIILLNNNGGGIFRQLPGLDSSPVADSFVAARHETTAQGICTQNDVGYLAAHNLSEMQIGVVTLLTRQSERPMLLEVFTDAEIDAKTLADYFRLRNLK